MNKQQKFINDIKDDCQLCMRVFDLPSSFIIANAINESGWGNSELAKKYNNYYGLKYSAVKNVYPDIKEVEVNACDGKCDYIVSRNFLENTIIMCMYLTRRKWKSGVRVYQDALNHRYNVKEFCNKLGNIYAPNAKEVHGISKGEMLMNLVNQYELKQYDNGNFF